MKYIPKIVYVITNGNYTEITYEEHLKRAEQEESYKDKKFILLHGVLVEVSLEEYKRFYRDKRRQKYIAEQARENGAVSYAINSIEKTDKPRQTKGKYLRSTSVGAVSRRSLTNITKAGIGNMKI